MNRDLIKNFVLRNNYYSFYIENYAIPKVLNTINKKNINIYQKRNESLMRRESSYSKKFYEDIENSLKNSKLYNKDLYYHSIKEFPIIIENRELWNNILNYLNIGVESSINTNYFLLDYFFPYIGLCIEIDSDYHNGKKLYDQARDIYIKTYYGVDTIRFDKYGENKSLRKVFLDKFNNKIIEIDNYYSNNGISARPWNIDYSELSINHFIVKNRRLIEISDLLIKFIGENKFMYTDYHNILIKDIIKFYPKELNNNIDKILIDNLIIFFKQVYGETLSIT